MIRLDRFRRDGRAVSPVIGSFLMVLVVVVAIGAFLSPMLLPSVQEAEPNANVEITFDGDETATVTYWNGETLQASQVTILVDGEQADSQFWGTVRPGDSVSIPVEPGDSVQVIWVSSEGTRSAVLGAAVVGSPTGSPTPTVTPSPSPTPESYYDVEIVDTNSPVESGDEMTFTVEVTNTGDKEGAQNVILSVDGEQGDSEPDVAIVPGSTKTLTLEWKTESNAHAHSPYSAVVNSSGEGDSDGEEVSVVNN